MAIENLEEKREKVEAKIQKDIDVLNTRMEYVKNLSSDAAMDADDWKKFCATPFSEEEDWVQSVLSATFPEFKYSGMNKARTRAYMVYRSPEIDFEAELEFNLGGMDVVKIAMPKDDDLLWRYSLKHHHDNEDEDRDDTPYVAMIKSAHSFFDLLDQGMSWRAAADKVDETYYNGTREYRYSWWKNVRNDRDQWENKYTEWLDEEKGKQEQRFSDNKRLHEIRNDLMRNLLPILYRFTERVRLMPISNPGVEVLFMNLNDLLDKF